MNIRWKVGALIATLLVVLCISELFVAVKVLLPSFAQLERADASVAMRRVRHAVDRSQEQLALSATSWGNWTDTYRFAKDRNRAFINENLTAIALRELAVNAMVVLDVKGRVIASAALELDSMQSADLNLLAQVATRADFPWRVHLTDGRAVRGILATARGPMLAAAAPVLDGFGGGPTRGMVIMGRFLSPGEITNFGSQAQVALSMLPPQAPDTLQRISETEDKTSIFESLEDVYGKPALTLRVDIPREITRRGRSAVYYSAAVLTSTAVVIVVLLILTLNRVVLNPLGRVIRHAQTIGESTDLTNRLDFHRSDEIGVLAGELDRMVERLAQSRRQLVDQSFGAGFAELAKGVLHNLGNAMTPIGVRLSMLHDRLQSIDDQDFKLVAQEIGSGKLDPQRLESLAELLHLAGDSLSTTLAAAREDVEVISRQTSVVQTALVEQLHSTRNEHVWEAVRMADLLAQTLEVVPDSKRGRLAIEFNDSIEHAQTLCLPRTILKLVLQNIVINAAESIGETGRAQGTLRVTAQTQLVADQEQLVLRCADDGAGIAADRLERIFDKGYSTKSRQTNFGIGLHWCANALAALGGRVWATSEGLGRGACIHVLLPLRQPPLRVNEAA